MLIKIFENLKYAESSLPQRHNSKLVPSDIFLDIHKVGDYTKIKLLMSSQ